MQNTGVSSQQPVIMERVTYSFSRFSHLLPLIAITLLVVALWLPFGFKTTGLVEEWTVMGMLREGHNVYFVTPDSILGAHALRPLTVLPHAIAYTLDPYSYVWYNIQQILFFIGKGIFTYLILFRLIPNRVFAFMVALLFVIYPADTGLFMFRAIHAHGSVMLYLVAAYLLLTYWYTSKKWVLLPMWGTLATSLFMYEIAYPLVAFTPFLLLWLGKGISKKVIVTSFLWYAAPLVTGLYVLAVLIVSRSNGFYQSSMAGSLTSGSEWQAMVDALITVYERSFVLGWVEALQNLAPTTLMLGLTLVIITIIVIVGLTLNREQTQPASPLRKYYILFLIGLAVILLGFLPFLPVGSHRYQTLRTYYLSSLGAALCFGVIVYLLVGRSRIIFLTVTSGIIAIAMLQAFQQHQHFVNLSLRQQRFLGQMVQQVTQVDDRTNIVVVDHTNLMDNEWFFTYSETLTLALRYIYHQPDLDALSCALPDFQTNSLAFTSASCVWKTNNIQIVTSEGEILEEIGYKDTIILEYTIEDELKLLEDIRLYNDTNSRVTYAPHEQIIPDVIPTTPHMFSCWPIETCTESLISRVPHSPFVLEFRDVSLFGSGWRSVEIHGNGKAFRWSIDEESVVKAIIDEDRIYRFQVSVLGILSPGGTDALTVTVNDVPVPLTLTAEPGEFIYEGIIPPGAVEAPIDEVKFMLDELSGIEGATLGLGIAVHSLKVEPFMPIGEVYLELDQPLAGTGWRGAETAPDGVTFQWSNQEESTVVLGVLALQDYSVEVAPAYILSPNTYEDVELLVGDTPLEVEYTTDSEGKPLMKAVLPAEVIEQAEQPISLTVKVPQLVEVEQGLSRLGIALDSIRVQPRSES